MVEMRSEEGIYPARLQTEVQGGQPAWHPAGYRLFLSLPHRPSGCVRQGSDEF